MTAGIAEVKVLDAVYYDTDDLRLVRDGVSLRHRNDRWTTKLPDPGGDGGGAMLARDEIDSHAPPGTPPDEQVRLVRSRSRAAALVPVVRLVTTRRAVTLRSAAGEALAEVADDRVEVLDRGGSPAGWFREIEVELAEGADVDLLRPVVERLKAAGAASGTPTPKVARALGSPAQRPPEVVAEGYDPAQHPPAVDVVRAAVAGAVERIIVHDPVIRLDTDPEGVHKARVGTRRLRSDLRTFGPLVEPAWSGPLRGELKWLADRLGQVRDADVLGARLQVAVDVLPPPDQAAAQWVLDRCGRERARALGELVGALDTARYLVLLDDLVEGARHPQVLPAAQRPASKVVPALARRPWRKLRQEVAALGPAPDDDALHQVRIRAKRARYAVEAVAPLVGPGAVQLAKALARLQDVLGDRHDAVVAEEWLRRAEGEASNPAVVHALGALIEAERRDGTEALQKWPAAWSAVDHDELSGWLR